jgi:hypothetical protein
MQGLGYVTRMLEKGNAYRIRVGKPWSLILLCDGGKVSFPVSFTKNEKSCA